MDASAERPRTAGSPLRMGMIFFLVSEASLFGSLFWTYYYLRIKSAVWPPEGVHLDMTLAIINTAFLLASSSTAWWAVHSMKKGQRNASITGLVMTIALGITFLGITGWEWAHETFRPWTSAYGSTFYTLTGFHALHVFGGVLLILALTARTVRGRFSATNTGAMEAGSLYWHFVDFIWILVFSTLFIVR